MFTKLVFCKPKLAVMKKNHLSNCLKFVFSAGLLLIVFPVMSMAHQNQGSGPKSNIDTPHVSKRTDTIRKVKPGQVKRIYMNPNVDHMPIARPDMKKFNMPVAGRDSQPHKPTPK